MAELAAALAGNSIEAVARPCRSALQNCVVIPSLMEYEWAENRLDEFKLWAATTGVFAGEKASLDARLAVEWETKNLVTSILILLLGCLEKCQRLAQSTEATDSEESTGEDEDSEGESVDIPEAPEQIPRAFSPWSDQSSASSLDSGFEPERDQDDEHQSSLQEAKAEVEQIIDHLTRLAIAIRKSGSNSRARKADKLFKPERHQRLRDHLNLIVLARGTEDGRDDYGVAVDSLTIVQERLIIANLRRKNRYLYAQRHARKLALGVSDPGKKFALSTDHDAPTVVDQVSQAAESNAPDVATEQHSVPRLTVNTQAHIQLPRPVLTATSASAVVQPIEPVPQQAATPSQVAKTSITTTTARIVYPRPPKQKGNIRYFQCPCCAQTLPEMFRQTTLWKKHLMADICPYTCIIEDCPKPDQLYVTRQEWMRHVEKEHQQCWQCPPCTVPGKAPRVFPTVDGLISHLADAHCDTIGEAQHSTIVANAARPVPSGTSSCPLCDSTGSADSSELLDHIAEHIHSFALRSLPWAKDESHGTDDNDSNSGDDDDYFDDDKYFDQGSEDHSQQDNVFTDSERDSGGLASLPSNTTDPARASPSVAPSVAGSEALSYPGRTSPHSDSFEITFPDGINPTDLPEPVHPGMMPEYMPDLGRSDAEIDEEVADMFRALLDKAYLSRDGLKSISMGRDMGNPGGDTIVSNQDGSRAGSSFSRLPFPPLSERAYLNPNLDYSVRDGVSSRGSTSHHGYAGGGIEVKGAQSPADVKPKGTRRRLRNLWNRVRPGGGSSDRSTDPTAQADDMIRELARDAQRFDYQGRDDLIEPPSSARNSTRDSTESIAIPTAPHPDRPSSMIGFSWDDMEDSRHTAEESSMFRPPPPPKDSYDPDAVSEVTNILKPLNWGQPTTQYMIAEPDMDAPDRSALKRQMRFDDHRRHSGTD